MSGRAAKFVTSTVVVTMYVIDAVKNELTREMRRYRRSSTGSQHGEQQR